MLHDLALDVSGVNDRMIDQGKVVGLVKGRDMRSILEL